MIITEFCPVSARGNGVPGLFLFFINFFHQSTCGIFTEK